MPTTDRNAPSGLPLLLVLLAANALLLGAWPWLRALPLGADSTDPPWKIVGKGPAAQRRFLSQSVLRNPDYLSSFIDAVRRKHAVLFLGTSETLPRFNLGAQLNSLFPDDPPMAVLAKHGTSPVHSALLFASCQRERIATPPLVLAINLVYFTQPYDDIDDGWLGGLARSEVFVQLDHRRVMQELSDGAKALYARHFRRRNFLYPLYAQEYLGNLIYLRFHQSNRQEFPSESLPIDAYSFDGTMPNYDRQRAVHAGYRAADQLAKGRWAIKPARDCLNLEGLTSTVAILERQKAPVLLLLLPTNRTFYAYNGIDMTEFDRRYQEIGRAIGRLQRPDHIFAVDLYESPWLDLGFSDRMHSDAYGFHQIAGHLGRDPTYRRFIDAVRAYYSAP